MSTPEGPERPWGDDPTAPPQPQYPGPAYQPGPYEPYTPPPWPEPTFPQVPPPPYPPQQQYPPQQYGPGGYQQPPGPGQVPPYGVPQYGPQPYGAQPYGGYPQTAPPNRPSNRMPLIIAAVAVVVIALAVVGVVLLTRGDDKNKDAQTPPPTTSVSAPPSRSSTSSAPTSSPAQPSGTVSPTTVEQITVPPVIPGWHGVLSYKENVAYDVPPDWKVETPGTLVGFEDSKGQPIAIMHGVSTYKDDACPAVSGSYRGHTGFKTAGDIDPTSAARSGLKTFADGVALRDDGSSAPISSTTLKDITVDQGKIRAKYARATVTLNDKSDCGSPSVVVVAVAFSSGPQATALFIGYFDQGVPDALPLATAEKIFTTLRPYKH